MVLVDTSVWVDHLRRNNRRLGELLIAGEVACHPFVIGELACGTLRNRRQILDLLQALPSLPRAEDDEVLLFIEQHDFMRRGLGLIDVHLLASAALAGAFLWTLDTRLERAAEDLKLSLGYRRHSCHPSHRHIPPLSPSEDPELGTVSHDRTIGHLPSLS